MTSRADDRAYDRSGGRGSARDRQSFRQRPAALLLDLGLRGAFQARDERLEVQPVRVERARVLEPVVDADGGLRVRRRERDRRDHRACSGVGGRADVDGPGREPVGLGGRRGMPIRDGMPVGVRRFDCHLGESALDEVTGWGTTKGELHRCKLGQIVDLE